MPRPRRPLGTRQAASAAACPACYCAVLYCAVPCRSVLYRAVLRCDETCCAVLCRTYRTVLYGPKLTKCLWKNNWFRDTRNTISTVENTIRMANVQCIMDEWKIFRTQLNITLFISISLHVWRPIYRTTNSSVLRGERSFAPGARVM